jgi:hypothetical protein
MALLLGPDANAGMAAHVREEAVAAGCSDAEMLGHLRGPGPHIRGCWLLDSILGKE